MARVKNTNCPFSLSLKVSISGLCIIKLSFIHNHSCHSLEASTFNSIPDHVLNEINDLFLKGESATTARHLFLKQLRLSCKDDIEFHIKRSNRLYAPRKRDFFHLYEKFVKDKFGGHDNRMFDKLEESLLIYKETHPQSRIKYQMFDGDHQPLIIAIVTPLMLRVHHKIKQSSELVFVDSTSNCEEHNLKIFLFCTHSVAGALPLGFLITSDEKEETLKQGFSFFKDCLPNDAFFGRGRDNGPSVFLTDNCTEEINSLKSVWPSSEYLLCLYHKLQQLWRWLTEKKHGISQFDPGEIFCFI